jgi:Holliday junction DNA helicase RuvB
MALPPAYIDMLAAHDADEGKGPKYGDDIFAGTDYPRTWDGFIGQEKAKEQLEVAAESAKARGARIDHTLLATGLHGVGKTTLATMLAFSAGVGLTRATGPIEQDEAAELMQLMADHDILFIDEAHLLRSKGDWLLPFMTEGLLYTPRGAIRMPNIAIVAATTDVGKLPLTLISRFMVQPTLAAYTDEEGARIAANLAQRMGIIEGLGGEHFADIGKAADNNPRVMRQIITQIRDLGFAYPDTFPNLTKAFEWTGVSRDGLSQTSRDILCLLYAATDNTQALDNLRANLGEPGPIHHHEQQLLRKGLVEVTGRGRKLTNAGMARARAEVLSLRERA